MNILIITANKSIFEIDPKTLERVNCFTFQQAIASFSAHNNKYIITIANNQIHIGDFENGNSFQIKSIQVHSQIISSVAFSANSKYLATCSYYTTCKIWSVQKYFQLINVIKAHTDKITSVSFSADGKYLTTGSYENIYKIINVEREFEILNKIQGEKQEITSVAISENGKYLATGSEKKIFKIWDIENGYNHIDEQIQGNFNWINLNAFEIIIKEQNNNLTLAFKNQRIFEYICEV